MIDRKCPLCNGSQINLEDFKNRFFCPRCEPNTLISYCRNSIEYYLITAEKIIKHKQASIIASVLNHKKLI